MPDFADEVTQRLADTEELAAAQKALSKMRRGEREVFTLCVWEGLDAATAAEALGVAVGNHGPGSHARESACASSPSSNSTAARAAWAVQAARTARTARTAPTG